MTGGRGAAASAGPPRPAASSSAAPPAAAQPAAPAADDVPSTADPLLKGIAAAVAQARKTHQPVGVDAATTPYATLTAKPDGVLTAQQFLAPQRAKVNGSWQSIDTTLVKDAGGGISAKATLAAVKLSGGGNGPLATVDDGSGHVLTFTWPGGALPVPTLSGDTATYAGVYPGVDLKMVALPGGVRDLLVVHDAVAAANPALKTISLGVTGTGLSVGVTPDGGVTAKDAAGHEILGGPAPMMWDSAGSSAPVRSAAAEVSPPARTGGESAAKPHTAKMPATVAQGAVTVVPDRSMLTASSTVWPLIIDPAWSETSEGPRDWMEIWSNGQSVYDGNPWPYANYDTSAVRVGNASGTLVRSLLSFPAFNLPKPSDYSAHPGDQSQNVTYIAKANLNLTAQSAVCPTTQVWRANPFNTGSNWSNQNGGSNTNLWPTSGPGWNNPVATIGGSTNCRNSQFSVDITGQVTDVYKAGGSTYTLGLRAANEGPTTSNYGSYFVQNAGGSNPNITIDYVSEPWLGKPALNSTPVGNHSGSSNPCGDTRATAGYLPVQAASVGLTMPVYDLSSRVVSWQLNADDYAPGASLPSETLNGGYGYSTAPTTATGQALTSITPTGSNGWNGTPMSLQDGHTYALSGQASDDKYATDGSSVNVYGQQLHDAWSNGGNNYPAPSSQPCWFTAALTPPNQPTVTQSTFPATGQHLASYPTVGSAGTITVNATAPTTPIDHFDWALNTTSTNEGAGNCTGIANAACGTVNSGTAGTSGLGTTNATVPINLASGAGNGEHWGDNYLYVSAVDKAGNVSAYGRYDFFLAQAFSPVSFGNVTGDGTPNLMGADKSGNLIVYPTNLDPAGSVNAVQVAPAASAPNGSSWASALMTHRGAERVQPTDDLFAWDKDSFGNGHLYYYFNAQTASASTQPGYIPPTTLNAFAQTQQTLVTRPSCTPGALNGGCVGYDPSPNWSSVQQLVALGPVHGGCAISAPTTACKTNLVSVETYQGATRVWLFSPAGTGQLTNPVLLSVSQPGWDWSRMRVMAPGNATGHPGGPGGMPDLWAEDPAGTLWQFTNHTDTGTLGAGLGDLSSKQQLGATGQFAPYTWVNTAGDLNADGNPDLWAMSPDGQVSVLLGPINPNLSAQGQTTATAIGWGTTSGVSNLQGAPLTGSINGQIVIDMTAGVSGQKCVDDLYGTTTNGTTVDLYDCNATWPQQWSFRADGTVRALGSNPATPSNVCLDTSGSLVQATKVTLWSCDSAKRAAFQTWRIIPSPAAAGRYWIYNPAAGMCLDDSGANTGNTNPFQLWPCWDAAGRPDAAQRFVLPTGAGQTQSVEAESVWGSVNGPASQVQGNCCGISLSNGNQAYFPGNAANQSVTLNYYVANAGTYSVTPALTRTNDRGQVSVTIDAGTAQAVTLPVTYDAYQASGVSIVPVHFGTATLGAGQHTFTFTMTGTNAASVGNRYVIGIDTLTLVPTGTNSPAVGLAVPVTGLVGTPVTADATASYPGTTGITGYTYDFGDGTVVGPQAAASASHTYATPGSYIVKATATDGSGTGTSTAAAITVTSGAAGQWKLSDGTGATAADTGNPGGHPGTLGSGVTWNPNGSATFDGTGQITAAPAVDTSKSFSAAAWVNLQDNTGYHFVVAQAGTTMESFYLDYDQAQHSWAMVMPTNDTASPGWTWAAAPASAVSLNTWTHLVGTYNATNGTISIYVNGVLAGTGTTTTAWNSATKAGSALLIGGSERAGVGGSRLTGGVADARVYQQALTSDQVSWLFGNSSFAPQAARGPINSPSLPGKCIDDYYGNQANGTHVNEWDCNGSAPQAWTMNLNGTITLTGSNGTKCLDITGGPGATANGTLVQLWDCLGNANQQWVAQSDGNGRTRLLNPNSGRCLDDPNGSLNNGTQLQIWDCLGNANQAWTPPLGTNLAAGAAATASSQTPGWEATHLTDNIYHGTSAVPGYASQFDSTANATEWAQIDLGSTHQIGEVDLFPRDEAANVIGAGFPVNFTIAVSTDGTNWTTVVTQANHAKPGDTPQQFFFNPTGARYIKVNATVLSTDQNGNHYFELRQIGVQGV
ncbi:ricin-type beta-trefoil lectin domain protein [Kitasatospora azatica]|uniref:ricin-type beta-trefoil lectin domain protein n=1 Tax=Kitasatospora azatica TaxID=58347 RepID=UPI0012FC7EE9|nr:ricin-type beta-trefoil lectin domain protein [Kitasatospora azatica]